MAYREIYAKWKADPEAYWLEAAGAIDWVKRPATALNASRAPLYEWFTDARVNTCWNAVDRHVLAGRGKQAAIIHDSPVTGTKHVITYAELLDRVSRLAGALKARGVGKGDRVIIYMPMVPEALEAMLACGRIGAIHSVVFGGFAAAELAVRIDDCKPKAILAASCGIEPNRVVHYKPLLDGAIDLASHKPDFCVILQREQEVAKLVEGRDLAWHAFQYGVDPAPCEPVEGNHPAYILYTSGTTGAPKGVVRPTAGHLVALAWTMRAIYDCGAGDVFWAASDVGWVVGHSYICYAPLIAGCTTIVYEGKPVGTPDAGAFWRVIEEHRVRAFFTAPTALRAIKRDDPEGKLVKDYDLSRLKALYLAGERADPDTIHWAQRHLNVPVVDHWWQTETGYAIAANPLGIEHLPVKVGSPSVAMPGFDVQVLDEGGHPLPAGQLGAIAIKLPLPPGTLPTLWNAEERFRKSYLSHFPGFYETGDAGYIDEDGYLYIMARTDDVINVAGHRLSTGAMEEVLANHPEVAECAVIGVSDALKGQSPLGFLCLNKGCTTPHDQIIRDCVQLMRDKIGPVADFKRAVVIDRLPKTRSGKILRGTMVKLADGEAFKMPATIDDPAILDEIRAALQGIGLAKG
ncbi:AMP-binding protein [Paragemmobacter straminiformis]|uniref:Propionyl-CoA synthetase n=1 Tax=Paragemmobacter straminiformis TaxID=2045119 RepID=A0A842I3W0_9RHOB|nr:propionyl-CoA synthetase [Gemmobacter straminiformis]